MKTALVATRAKHGYWFAVAAWVLVALASPRLVCALAENREADLTGVVKARGGQAIPNASIFIYTAGPRVGAGYL